MKLNKNIAKRIFLIVAIFTIFIALLLQVSSDEEKVRYSDMEKEEIGDDDESQEALQEYYGELLGKVKKNAKFNTIATQGDIVVLNVTINGKDRRILTRLRTATLFPGQGADLTNAKLIRTENLVVLGNISLKGNLFFDAENSFGLRRFYGIGSASFRYVDEGFARLVNGKANVSINPVLRELISGYNVFLSAEGLTRGIYVAEKTSSYFVVKSVNANSNVAFSWMLRGVKKEFDGKLISQNAREKGIEIRAEIDFENGRTEIKINGLDNILNLTSRTSPINESLNQSNATSAVVNQSNQSMILITGNLIDEFGLETDLGQILGEATILPDLTDTSSETTLNDTQENITDINETITPETDITSNETLGGNESIVSAPSSVLEFTLYSTNEDFIVSEVSFVTGLSLGQVKKLINFVYTEPAGFEDEVIEPLQPSLDFIEKINGSVVIRLG